MDMGTCQVHPGPACLALALIVVEPYYHILKCRVFTGGSTAVIIDSVDERRVVFGVTSPDRVSKLWDDAGWGGGSRASRPAAG